MNLIHVYLDIEVPRGMDKSLAKIDLNLLKALHVLLEERSVTRAAARLFITQSAMSKSLRRLRILVGDPLFLPSPQGLLPTPKAEEIGSALTAGFVQLQSYLSPTSFDPASSKGCLRIAAPEQFALGAIPQLLMRMQVTAPDLSIESLHMTDDHLALLAAGTLDFVINLDRPYPEAFITHPLLSAAPIFCFRRDHPLARKRQPTLAALCSYPQIAFRAQNVSAEDYRLIEQTLAAAGIRRRVLLDTSHLLIAIDMLARTDAVMLAPDYLSRLTVFGNAIRHHAIDHIAEFDRLRINLSLVQHSRTLNSPLHRWLVCELLEMLGKKRSRKDARADPGRRAACA